MLRQLRAFRAVAEARSFTQAAATLGWAQSSVTALIQALEREFEHPLLERLGKRVTLTEAGSRLLAYAAQLIEIVDEARAAVGGEGPLVGTLTIGTPETVCAYRLPPVLRRFRERHPGVQLVFKAGISTGIRTDVIEGRLDLAFTLDRYLPSPALVIEPLLHERVLLLTHAGDALALRERIAPADLEGVPLVLTEVDGSYRTTFENALGEQGCRPGARIEFASVEAIKQCTIAGIGVTVLPAVVAATELRDGRLIALPWTGCDLDVAVRMIRHKDKHLSPAILAFQEIVRELLVPSYSTRSSIDTL